MGKVDASTLLHKGSGSFGNRDKRQKTIPLENAPSTTRNSPHYFPDAAKRQQSWKARSEDSNSLYEQAVMLWPVFSEKTGIEHWNAMIVAGWTVNDLLKPFFIAWLRMEAFFVGWDFLLSSEFSCWLSA